MEGRPKCILNVVVKKRGTSRGELSLELRAERFRLAKKI